MQYNRSYSGNIVIDPQDTLPDGPRPGVYSGRAYLKLWRKWRTKEKPLGAKYAFITAFRQAGVPIDLKSLRTCLNDKSLALIGTEERTLLRIYSEIVCQRRSSPARSSPLSKRAFMRRKVFPRRTGRSTSILSSSRATRNSSASTTASLFALVFRQKSLQSLSMA